MAGSQQLYIFTTIPHSHISNNNTGGSRIPKWFWEEGEGRRGARRSSKHLDFRGESKEEGRSELPPKAKSAAEFLTPLF